MKGVAYIDAKDGIHLSLDALDCARLACQAKGWDVDAEPLTGDQWKVTATSRSGSVSLSKKGSLTEACTRLIESLYG